MDVILERCAGLDVHKATVTAAFATPAGRGAHAGQHTFGTTTPDLLALRDWLAAHRVTHVAMESTGVYWKPVYYTLEDGVPEVLLVNATHVAKVPGRKTDVSDSVWIAQRLECGLLRAASCPRR